MSNYATKTDLKNATGTNASSFAENTDLVELKSDIDKLDIDKLKNIPTNLSNLKSKLDKLDIDKLKTIATNLSISKNKEDKLDIDELVPVPVDLSKPSDVVKNYVAKKDMYNAKIKNIEDKMPDITNLAANASLNAKINEVKSEISSNTNLATTTAPTAVENKTPSVSNLAIKVDYDA